MRKRGEALANRCRVEFIDTTGDIVMPDIPEPERRKQEETTTDGTSLSAIRHRSGSPFTSSSLCKMRCKPRLCIRIVWVPGVDETCSAGAQQSFYLLDRFATRSTPTKIGAIVQVTRIDPGMVFT
jgi:hypothetical protein